MVKSQKSIAELLAYLLFFSPMLFSINLIYLGLFNSVTIIDTIILYAILLIFLFNYFNAEKSEINYAKLGFFLFFALGFLFTALFFPENIKYLWTKVSDIENPLYVFLFLTLPAVFVAMNIVDIDILLSVLEKWSIAIIILYFFQYLVVVIKDLKEPQYMVYSYNMLFSAVLLFILALSESRIYRWVLSIVGLLLIFITGARGAFISGIASIIVCVLFLMRKNKKMLLILLLLAVTVIPILFINFNNILLWLAEVLESYGIESRTINSILNESFLYESGRDSIRTELYSNLNILGHGFAGEKVITNGRYSHNLFLSLICDCGILFGGLISIFIVVIIIKALFRAPYNVKILLCAFLSTGLFRLMLSGSYLKQEPALYILLGLCLNKKLYEQTDKLH